MSAVLALAAGMVIIAAPTPSRAIEVGFGLSGMYDMWLPAFRYLHAGEACKLAGEGLKHDNDGGLMLGPELGIYTMDWKLNLQVLFGVTKNDLSYSSAVWDATVWNFVGPPSPPYIMIGEGSTRRYDADLKVAVRLNDYFNFNIGGRFNYGDGEGSQFRFHIPLAFNYGNDSYHIWQVGPELGIGFNYTIEGFTIYLDANVLVNGGNNYLERKLAWPGLFPYVVPFKYDTDFLGFGFDTDAGVSYYIEKAHILLGMGFRWVGVVCVSLSDYSSTTDLTHKEGWMTGEWDHLYGLTFNVGFRF